MGITRIINTKSFKVIFFIVAIVYSFSFTTWTMWTDPYYWINSFNYYDSNKMALLSLLVGKIFISLTNASIFYENLLGWIFSIGSILIFYFSIIKDTERIEYLNYLSVGIIFLGGWTQNMYNPDSLTLFFFTIISVIIYKTKEYNYTNALVLGVLAGLSVISRFPNILIIPVLVLYIAYVNHKQNISNRKNILIATLLASVAIAILLATWLYITLVTQEPEINQMDPSHSYLKLIDRAGFGLRDAACKVLALIGFLYISKYIPQKNKFIVKLILAMVFLCMLFHIHHTADEPLSWKPTYAFIIISILIYIACNKKNYEITAIYLCFICFSLIAAAGSDTYMMKTFTYMAIIAPIAFINLKRECGISSFEKMLIVTMAIYSIGYFSAEFRQRKCFTLSGNNRISIMISDNEKEQINEILNFTRQNAIDENKVIFFGAHLAHPSYIAMGIPAPYKASFWQLPNDKAEIEQIANVVRTDSTYSVVNLCSSEYLDDAMLKLGMSKKVGKDMSIYFYPNKIKSSHAK